MDLSRYLIGAPCQEAAAFTKPLRNMGVATKIPPTQGWWFFPFTRSSSREVGVQGTNFFA